MNRVSTDFEQHIILDESGEAMVARGGPSISPELFGLRELRVEYDADTKSLWTHMVPKGRPSFTPSMLLDFERWQDLIEANFGPDDLRFLVLGSHAPGVFCYGGDLALFRELIIAGDRASLVEYGHRCCRILHRNINTLGLPLVTIGLVQGDALGGGLEALLSFDFIIAEESASFGLPEILFGLFPGMGAHAFLSRQLGSIAAERLITSGKSLSADEMLGLGLIHEVVPDGAGEAAVQSFIEKNSRRHAGLLGSRMATKRSWDLSLLELTEITEIWADTALKLTERDLKLMGRLAEKQRRAAQQPAEVA
ncbi:crotonase/enoyl-CoA hydratase family protein [Alteriqipengyuania lutimaris]|uniref:Enoyl-CoA hydratase n=1 Tax=Alteriqipengyuania lutimaris TaxID=1538146 RepID=A0A395LN07_9SPHN|nr:crotonase/enoyl-CoA hydratase family protein [Alteriqipengyuania lutimaris]MBB3032762.1 DSF synthase [Alteriqipengyuania lutimaris]RDS78135.1 enoyl-CoA hydratase [Alteriqipengyuania lutimaris]